MKTINIKGQSYNLTYNQDKIDFTVLQTSLINNYWAKDKEIYTFYTFITCKNTTYRIFADCRDGSIKITEKISNVDDYYPWSELKKANKLVGISVNSVDDENDEKWLSKKEVDKTGCWLTFMSEGNDIEGNSSFSRKPHWPGGTSGITIGRGYDLKNIDKEDSGIYSSAKKTLTLAFEGYCNSLNKDLYNFLYEACQSSGENAKEHISNLNNINKNRQYISKKQQYYLFKYVYNEQKKYATDIWNNNFYKYTKMKISFNELPIVLQGFFIDIIYVGFNPSVRETVYKGMMTLNTNEVAKIIPLCIKQDTWTTKTRWTNRQAWLNSNGKNWSL